MSDDIIRIKSLSKIFKGMGFEEPKHPLIGVIDASKMVMPEEMRNQKVVSDYYAVMMKDADCGMQYGRNYYDFEEGVLVFIGPGQVMSASNDVKVNNGWMLFFHPDLIRQSNLGKHINDYSFFSYDVYEALHLSKKEEGILNDCISKIEYELDQNIDGHSQALLVSNLELLLNYCNRFYERQFHTRSHSNKDVVSEVEQLIREYYNENKQLKDGSPTIQYFADKVNLSANYLSDLLKKETGRNTKEHINDYVVELAKTKLLNSQGSVSEIAYDLGYNYPHYFSRVFKQKTGLTPQKYRDINLN